MLDRKKLHVGIVMDGNRRWAKANNKTIFYAYDKGAEVAKTITEAAFKKDLVSHLTLWVLSEENINKRPKLEVAYIISSFHKLIRSEWNNFIANNVSFNVIGNTKCFSENVLKDINLLTLQTKNNKYKLYLAINYDGKQEIIHGFYNYLNTNHELPELSSLTFHKFLYASNMPDVDLVIRTGNRKSLSGFLLWHIDQAELLFLEKMWPDFSIEDLQSAIKFLNKLPEKRLGR